MEHTAKPHRTGNDRSVRSIILREMRQPAGFILALVVGGTLTFTRRFESIAVYLPFAVPWIVSFATRATSRIRTRRRELLLDLPAYRRDPAFIMDCQGWIVASTGETERLFKQRRIAHLDQLLAGPDGSTAGETLLGDGDRRTDRPYYSPVTERWYRVQLRGDHRESDWLVWLDDVTDQVRLEKRKDTLRVFTRRLQQELLEQETASDDDRRLAHLLLEEGYQAIMLARVTANNGDGRTGIDDSKSAAAQGVVYTVDGGRYGPFPIPAGVEAPIMRSRKLGHAIRDDRRSWNSLADFERTYPVLPEVAEVLGGEIRNFANYHSGDVSIIAFNKNGQINPADIAFLESAADTAVTAFSLLDLARRADHRFIQSIHGICAAAEYSDELTGGHIWRVNDYSRHLAEAIGLPVRTRDALGTVAALHDIGKVAIPHLIKLPRALDEQERREMQLHTIYGAQIIDRMRRASEEKERRLDMAYLIALHHHQHWNGTGYPGLVDKSGTVVNPDAHDWTTDSSLRPPAREEIPRVALIVSLADKYDALRSCRQYKPAFSHDRTIELLNRDDRSGLIGADVFGRDIHQAFMDNHREFARIYEEGQTEALCETGR